MSTLYTSPPTTAPAALGGKIEKRSVGYIPADERYGTPWNQFTLWFGANLQITCLVTGALAFVFGGDVVWSIIGLFIGQVLGGCVMALHAAQGPQLGLPQMISSRAQFGVYGAAIPLFLIVLMYLGFSASGTVLAGQATAHLFHAPEWVGIAGFGALSALFAIIGYSIIHKLGRWATIVSSIAFVYLIYRFVVVADVEQLLRINEFTVPSFLLAMALSASWQIAYGPYVADYSRYLPTDTNPRAVFCACLGGSVLSATIAMTFGVLLAAYVGEGFRHHEVEALVSLGPNAFIAGAIYLVIALGKLCVNVLNTYGGFMSVSTIWSGLRGKAEIPPQLRVVIIVLMTAVAVGVAMWGRGNFLDAFSSFLLFLLTFFTPWSAINLVDYYFISKDRYDVPALSDPNGRYGKWNAAAIISFILGILIQLPFVDTKFYSGPMVERLGNTDVSWMIGLAATTILYLAVQPLDKRVIPEETILPAEES